MCFASQSQWGAGCRKCCQGSAKAKWPVYGRGKQCLMPSWYSCIYQFVRDSLCQCGISWSFLLIYRYMFRSMWSSRKNHWSISIAFFKAQSFQWIFFLGGKRTAPFLKTCFEKMDLFHFPTLSQVFAFRFAFLGGGMGGWFHHDSSLPSTTGLKSKDSKDWAEETGNNAPQLHESHLCSGMKHQMYHLHRDHQHLHGMEHQRSREARGECARWVRPPHTHLSGMQFFFSPSLVH